MAIIRFVLEIEDVDHEDFNIRDNKADNILADLEEVLAKKSYSLFDSSWERDD